jgi:hypothetical protein
VNSLKARLEKVSWWLERARSDVLLMQETKLADSAAPLPEFRAALKRAHHGEGQGNIVAVASRVGISDGVTKFGEPLRAARTIGRVALRSQRARPLGASPPRSKVNKKPPPTVRTIGGVSHILLTTLPRPPHAAGLASSPPGVPSSGSCPD